VANGTPRGAGGSQAAGRGDPPKFEKKPPDIRSGVPLHKGGELRNKKKKKNKKTVMKDFIFSVMSSLILKELRGSPPSANPPAQKKCCGSPLSGRWDIIEKFTSKSALAADGLDFGWFHGGGTRQGAPKNPQLSNSKIVACGC